LLEVFEKERHIWPGDSEKAPMNEIELADLGTKIIGA